MSASVSVDVGTRGAIGSLLKEIEYRRLELDCGKGISNKSLKSTVETDSGGGGGHSWPSFGFLRMKWKKKKRRGTGGGLPAMCFVVEVSESCRLSEIPGFSYWNLKVHFFVVLLGQCWMMMTLSESGVLKCSVQFIKDEMLVLVAQKLVGINSCALVTLYYTKY